MTRGKQTLDDGVSDLDDLESKAKAATPGPYCAELRELREELLEWKRLASSIVEAEEAGDVKFRQCTWSSEWSAEFLRLAGKALVEPEQASKAQLATDTQVIRCEFGNACPDIDRAKQALGGAR